LFHGGLDLLHHRLRALLQLGREHLLHERLAERLADVAVCVLHAALPAGAHFRHAAQIRPVEVEIGANEGRGKVRSAALGKVPAEVAAPGVDRLGLQHPTQLLVERGLGHVEGLEVCDPHTDQVAAPIEVWRQRLELGPPHLVIRLVRVALLDGGEGRLRQGGFDPHDRRGVGRRGLRGLAEQLEHPLHVCHVLLADLPRLVVVARVVVPIGQAEAAGRREGDDL